MAKGILIAAMNIGNAAADEFHDWYDTEHLPERQRVPGFLLCQRWIGAAHPKISLATAMKESRLRNLDHGDRDSLGLFQQRPSQGWGTPEQVQDPVYAAGKFYDHLVQFPGWETGRLTDVAQGVQRSGFPEAYQKHEGMAVELADALAHDTDPCA